ncbi:hypothetical protein [Winogradskyella immobilis]|uniref:O-antigen ligase-like membrane protein n=1 Tax=Winogradskyella immobilis TaxID=2816852 RepID=A0ABS8ELP3_9FLAO|nr:hypothetical protein [Winogradskyella immobilis]MCC1483485.1 hypothetical protein [Winogradskyella immobilis]MCG0015579.1 hypothetical protein [Winogradskyella immobilis]
MKLIQKSYKYLVVLIYLSFAFDSLLKINIGIKIHIGILSIIVLNIGYFFLVGFKKKIKLLKLDQWLILFTIYVLINGLVKVGIDSLFIFLYLFLALNVYFFVKVNFKTFTKKVFYTFQILLIVTGLTQLLLVWIFDYQLSFLDIAHYDKGSSVSLRLRGFFVEPNWFAIAFTFNTFLLIKNDIFTFFKRHITLSVFTTLVLLLNGSFGTLIILVFTYGYQYLKKNIVIGLFLVLIGGFSFYLILEKRSEFKKGKSGIELFNYYSRTEPFKRVNAYFDKQPVSKRVFGEGFGSWASQGVIHRLSVLNYKIRPHARDSSELHVFLFEIGLFGTFLFFLDIFSLYRNNLKSNYYISGAITLFIVCFLLYPIFKFLMYMIYYFIFRALIQKNKKEFLLEREDD